MAIDVNDLAACGQAIRDILPKTSVRVEYNVWNHRTQKTRDDMDITYVISLCPALDGKECKRYEEKTLFDAYKSVLADILNHTVT